MNGWKSCRWFWSAVAALALALIWGCATPPGSRMTADPAVGYWLAAAAGNTRQQEACVARVANAEYPRRVAGSMPGTLHELRAYRTRLLAPVEIDASLPAGSPDLRGVSPEALKEVRDYIATHRADGTISGALYVKEWADELARLASAMTALEGRVGAILQTAEARLKAGNIAEAEAAWLDAQQLDRDGADILRLETQLLAAKSKAALGALGPDISGNYLKRAADLQKKFGTPESTETNVAGCLAILADADNAIRRVRDSLKTAAGRRFEADQVDKELLAPEKDIAALRGKCWAEQVRLLAARKKYWPAYRYAGEKLEEAAVSAEHRRTAATAPLMESYRQMLLAATSELVTQANNQLDRDAYGIALTLCRMAEEVVQFARDRRTRIPDEVAIWEKRCAESRGDAQKKIDAAMQRRLVIGDFSPLTRENQKLAAKVLAKCTALLSDNATNKTRLARGLVVGKPGEKTREGDYVIECSVPEFLIIDAPPVEIERAVVKVGRDIREIQNPQYNPDAKNVTKTVFSQEVYLYQTIRRRHSKKARLQAAVTGSLDAGTRNILSLDLEFGEGRTALDGIQFSSVEELLDVPFLGPPRIAESSRSLSVDPWPRAVPATLSPDAEITEALQCHAAELIGSAIVESAGGYPVDVLAAEAVRHGKLGNKAEAANAWGLCLEYCSQLYGAAEGASWLTLRDRMLSRIPELCKTAWRNCNGEVLKKMPGLWTEATDGALEAVAQSQ